jgi:uncharacterized LabA/DUF88 family protein
MLADGGRLSSSECRHSEAAVSERVVAYVDGFNLYFGLKDKGWQRYYWLDLVRLVRLLVRTGQQLIVVKYFTALVSSTPDDPDKSRRQVAFLEALGTLSSVRMYYGHYLQKTVRCRNCGARWYTHEEKKTDVNIAAELLYDAYGNQFDVALLVSGDSDLADVVGSIPQRFPGKRVIVAFPPARHSLALGRAASSSFTLGRANLARSQFPDSVAKPDGFVLQRPASWR